MLKVVIGQFGGHFVDTLTITAHDKFHENFSHLLKYFSIKKIINLEEFSNWNQLDYILLNWPKYPVWIHKLGDVGGAWQATPFPD